MQCHETTLGTVPKTAKRFEQRKQTVRVPKIWEELNKRAIVGLGQVGDTRFKLF